MALRPPSGKASPDSASPFFRKIGSRKRPFKRVPLPGWLGEDGGEVGLWALRDDEIARARAAAMAYLTDTCKLDSLKLSLDPTLYDDELSRQILAIALRDPDQPERSYAEDAAELRLFLEPDARQALMQAYNAWVEERSPLTRARNDAELRELVSTLGEAHSASAYLAYCDSATLRDIARELAGRLKELMKPSSSNTGSSS